MLEHVGISSVQAYMDLASGTFGTCRHLVRRSLHDDANVYLYKFHRSCIDYANTFPNNLYSGQFTTASGVATLSATIKIIL